MLTALSAALLWPASPLHAAGPSAATSGIVPFSSLNSGNSNSGNSSSNGSSRTPRPLVGCLIGPERVADIGTPVVGVVSAMKVDRGDSVSAGETLVLLHSGVESASVEAASARTAIEADVRAAEANARLAAQRHSRTVSLVAEGFVTALAAEQARAERDVAVQKLAQARGQHTVQQRELGQVQAQLAQRTLRSPFRGVVVERFVNAGERVDDKPLLRLAMLDPLRVELVLPAHRWGSVARGDPIDVLPELPGATPVVARVTHVDKVIDATSNTFRVRLTLPNPGDRLPAGARCKVDGLAAPAASVAAVMPAAVMPAAVMPAAVPPATVPPATVPPATVTPAASPRPAARSLFAIARAGGLRASDHPIEARTEAERRAAQAEQQAAAAALNHARQRRPAPLAAGLMPGWLRVAAWTEVPQQMPQHAPIAP